MRIDDRRLEEEIKSIPNKAGVYCLYYHPTGKKYIGASLNMRGRIKSHIYSITRGADHPMTKDVLSMGTSGLIVSCLEVVEKSNLLAEREKWYQDNMLNESNMYNPSTEVKPNYNW